MPPCSEMGMFDAPGVLHIALEEMAVLFFDTLSSDPRYVCATNCALFDFHC